MALTRRSLRAALVDLGVTTASVVMVHAGLRALGPIVGGAAVVVQALQDAVGPEGTLVAYIDFEPFYDETSAEADVPAFDKRVAPAARDHGVLHETLRTWPGARRSDHPDAGVVAIGHLAEWITSTHPFNYGYGPGTPFERVLQAKGQALLLGAPLDSITLLHYPEHQARIRGKRVVTYRRLMPEPQGPVWTHFEEFDTSRPVSDRLGDDCFGRIAEAYLASGRGREAGVGSARACLFDGPDLIAFALRWIEQAAIP